MDKYEISFEPMDVDRSSTSTSKMDISCDSIDDAIHIDDDFSRKTKYCDITPIKVEKVCFEPIGTIASNPEETPTSNMHNLQESESEYKPMHRQTTATKKEKRVYHIKKEQTQGIPEFSTFQRLFFGSLLAGVVMLAHPIIHFKCAEEIDLVQMKQSFSINLFGQTAAASKIIDTLNLKVMTKILFFYGGTGVGKTYSISLMLDDLRKSANIYHYTMPTFRETFSTDLMIGLSVCHTTIVVVDDLTINDMDITSQLQKLIDKSEKLGKNITVVLVYNCDNITENFVKKCDHFFHYDLEENFKNIKGVKEYIKFEPLTQEHLEKCIETELGDRELTRAEMEDILKNFDVSLDGCKGVYTKIRLLNPLDEL